MGWIGGYRAGTVIDSRSNTAKHFRDNL